MKARSPSSIVVADQPLLDPVGQPCACRTGPAAGGCRRDRAPAWPSRLGHMAEVVELWTDGACSGNPGPGGWAAVLRWNGHEREVSGGEADTTNNRMELMSVIMGLAAIRGRWTSSSTRTRPTSSRRSPAAGWTVAPNGWRTEAKQPVKNQDLWERLYEEAARHRVSSSAWRATPGRAERARRPAGRDRARPVRIAMTAAASDRKRHAHGAVRRHRRRLRPLGADPVVRQRPALARPAGRPAAGGAGLAGGRRRDRYRRGRADDRLAARLPRGRHRPERGDAGPRRASGCDAAGMDGRIELVEGEAESLPLEDGVGGRAGAHLPAALRRRPAGGAARAGAARCGRAVRWPRSSSSCPAGAWYPAWWAWTRIGLPAAGLTAGGGWYRTGRFLGPSIEGFWSEHPLEQVLGWWRDAGIGDLHVQRLSVGGAVMIRGTKT